MDEGEREDWLKVLRRRAAGLPDEEIPPAELPPVMIDFVTRERTELVDAGDTPEVLEGESVELPPIDEHTVEFAHEIFERAAAGEFDGLFAIVRKPDNSFSIYRTPSLDSDLCSVIGQLEINKTWLAEEVIDLTLGMGEIEEFPEDYE